MDVLEFFLASNRGLILVTTRNLNCKIHTIVGSYKFKEMDLKEVVMLFLRATRVEDTTTKIVQKEATIVAKTLGCLALAIV
jgi:predicted nucleic acid-binding protein